MKFLYAIMAGSLCVSLSALSLVEADDGPPALRRSRSGGPPALTYRHLTPDDSVVAAATDIANIPADYQYNIRYLSLYNIPNNDRVAWIQTLNFLINSLSRSRVIKHVFVVPGTDNSLLRVDMTDYQFYDETTGKTTGWDSKTWDKLGELDVSFSSIETKTEQAIVVEKIKKTKQVSTGRKLYVPNGYGGYNIQDETTTEEYYEEKSTPGEKKTVAFRGVPPWVNERAAYDLRKATKSKTPILRGDFFNARASLPPFYHDFLGFGNNVKDFLAAVVLSAEDIKRAQLEIKGVVVKSGAGLAGKVIAVSENNRFISRTQGPYGYVWRTRDVEKLKDNNDYLRTLSENFFDASEWIATGRNGLQWYFLSNNKDERQDEAPIAIVRDDTNDDRRVINGRSCITCHPRGINEFLPLPQELIKNTIDIVSPDYFKSKKLRESFINNTDEFFNDDNRIYAKAVKIATTVTIGSERYDIDTETNARQFGKLYNSFNGDIDLNRASYEFGMPVKDLMVALAGAKNDPYLLGLSRNKPNLTVPRVHFDRSFQQGMRLVIKHKGYRSDRDDQ